MLAGLLVMAFAAAPHARLEYEVRDGVVGCPDEQWLRSQVSARLGRDPFDSNATLVVKAVIAPAAPSGLVADVEVTRADGTVGRRHVDSPSGDCLELASAVELATALAIDPLLLSRKPKKPEEKQAPVVVPPAPVEVRSNGPELHARAGLMGSAGGVPGFTGGLLLGGVAAWSRFSLAVEGRVVLPTSVIFSFGRSTTFTASGAVLPCVGLSGFTACGEVLVGAFQVTTTTDTVRRVTTVMAQAGARISYEFHPTLRLGLAPWVEALVVLTRTSIISGDSTLWVTWPVAISFGLTVEMNFSS